MGCGRPPQGSWAGATADGEGSTAAGERGEGDHRQAPWRSTGGGDRGGGVGRGRLRQGGVGEGWDLSPCSPIRPWQLRH